MTDATFELGLRRPQFQMLRHLTEYGCFSRLYNQHVRGSAGRAGAREGAVGPLRQAGICRDGSWLFLNQEGLAGKYSLVNEEIFCFQHDTVCRDQAARR